MSCFQRRRLEAAGHSSLSFSLVPVHLNILGFHSGVLVFGPVTMETVGFLALIARLDGAGGRFRGLRSTWSAGATATHRQQRRFALTLTPATASPCPSQLLHIWKHQPAPRLDTDSKHLPQLQPSAADTS